LSRFLYILVMIAPPRMALVTVPVRPHFGDFASVVFQRMFDVAFVSLPAAAISLAIWRLSMRAGVRALQQMDGTLD